MTDEVEQAELRLKRAARTFMGFALRGMGGHANWGGLEKRIAEVFGELVAAVNTYGKLGGTSGWELIRDPFDLEQNLRGYGLQKGQARFDPRRDASSSRCRA